MIAVVGRTQQSIFLEMKLPLQTLKKSKQAKKAGKDDNQTKHTTIQEN